MAMIPRVSNHPVASALAQLESLLQTAGTNFPGQQTDLMARGRAFAKVLRERLEDPAADLLWEGALSNAHSWAQQAASELQQAINSGTLDVLVNNSMFQSAVDAFAQNLGQYPVSLPADALAGQLDEAQRRVQTIQDMQIQTAADIRAERDRRSEDFEEFKDELKGQLNKLADQRRASENLLAALGGEASAQGYSDTSDAEKQTADNWRKVTSGLAVLTAVAAFVLFIYLHDPGVENYLRRAGVLVPLVLMTLYAGRQSAEHRREEREARRLQLAFGSVSAYLADVDDVRRADLKAQLSTQLFGSSAGTAAADSPGEAFPSTVELVRALIETATRSK